MTPVPLQPAGAASPVDAVFVFLVNLLVGTLGIATGARLVVDADVGYRRAAFTALVGAVVRTGFVLLLGWLPLLGPLLALVAWVGVINWRPPGGWVSAAAIGGVAWAIAVGVLYALSLVDVVGPSALGIPGA